MKQSIKPITLLLLMLSSGFANGQATEIINNAVNEVSNEEEWGDEEWGETESSPWQITGFVEAAYGTFLQSNPVASASSLKELRTRINVDYSHQYFEFSANGDWLFDRVTKENAWQTRELNIAFSPIANLDMKLGRQVLTWGTGDYVFLNDLFAKDWQSFFSGRDDQYLKAPSDSAKATWYYKGFSFDLVWTPEFTPDNYLTGERFSFYSPQYRMLVAPADNFSVQTTNSDQWSVRIATNKNSVEYALYGYKGFWPTPVGMKTTSSQVMTPYFPRLNSWGASARMPLGNGLFNAEYAHYNSVDDADGNNPMIANSQERFLLGYETELATNLTLGAQYYLEQTKDYQAFIDNSPTPDLAVKRNRQLITVRLTYMAVQQKLRWSLFNFYSPSDDDGYLKASVNYRYSDRWSFALGGNIFWGEQQHSFFGQHEQNSNAWLRVTAQF